MQRIAYRNSRGIAPGEITGRRSMVIILEVSWRSAGGQLEISWRSAGDLWNVCRHSAGDQLAIFNSEGSIILSMWQFYWKFVRDLRELC